MAVDRVARNKAGRKKRIREGRKEGRGKQSRIKGNETQVYKTSVL